MLSVTQHPHVPVDPLALAHTCRHAGLKATPQRLAVLRCLFEASDHPSPEAVFRRVREELHSISLATIYNTLDSLEAKGLVSRVMLQFDAKRYDANRSPHHHLICTVCGCIEDYEDPRLPPKVQGSLGGFTPREVRVQILGVCGACRSRSPERGPTRAGGTPKRKSAP